VQIVSPGDTPKDLEQPSTAGGVVLAKPASFPMDLPEGDAMRSSLDTLLDPDRWAILKLESTTPGRGRMLLARTSSSMQEAGSAQPGTPDRPLSVASLGPATEHATLRLPTLRNATALVIGLEEDVTGSFAAPTPTAWQPDWGFLEEKLSQDATRAEAAAQMQRVELQSMRCVFVEVAIVSLASVPEKDLRASPWLPGEVFDAACVASNPPGEVAAANCPLGGQLRLLPRGVRLQLTDQHVSQTGFFPVVEPSVACLPDGNFVEATVHGTPDPSLFRVDLRVDRHRLEPEIERRSLPDGDIELAKGRSQVFATSLITPPRKTVVVGLARPAQGSDSKGFLLLLRVTPEGRDAGSATQAPIECIDIGALTKPFPHVQVWENPFGVNGEDLSPIMPNEDAPGPVSEAQLSAALHSVQGPSGSNWANVGHFILAESGPRTERRPRDSLAALSRDTLRPYVIELWQGSMKPSALEPLTNGRARVEDWLEIMQREGLHVRALVTAGASSAVADFAARAYAADLNRVTGGSIDAVIEVGDIEMRTVSEGLALDLQCDPLPGMDAVQLKRPGRALAQCQDRAHDAHAEPTRL
jgi:hypothetical protein